MREPARHPGPTGDPSFSVAAAQPEPLKLVAPPALYNDNGNYRDCVNLYRDGRISREEVPNIPKFMDWFNKQDKNHDGVVDLKEMRE